jgi:hypothetical protein
MKSDLYYVWILFASNSVQTDLAPLSRVLLQKLANAKLANKFHAILWNMMIHYRVQKASPLVPILNHISRPNPANLISYRV